PAPDLAAPRGHTAIAPADTTWPGWQSGFFFQAEDGIRDGHVTGVQTCALPICAHHDADERRVRRARALRGVHGPPPARERLVLRSEERRVGKEGIFRWSTHNQKKNSSCRHLAASSRRMNSQAHIKIAARWNFSD